MQIATPMTMPKTINEIPRTLFASGMREELGTTVLTTVVFEAPFTLAALKSQFVPGGKNFFSHIASVQSPLLETMVKDFDVVRTVPVKHSQRQDIFSDSTKCKVIYCGA